MTNLPPLCSKLAKHFLKFTISEFEKRGKFSARLKACNMFKQQSFKPYPLLAVLFFSTKVS